MASSRLFIAFPLSEKIRAQCRARQDRGRARIDGIKWVKPEQMHLTLLFLGQIETETQIQIETIIQDLAGKTLPFCVTISDIGVFPETQAPKVLWAGVSEEETLMRCQMQLSKTLSMMGLPPDVRPFRPHLTLARIKTRIKKKALNLWMEEEARVPDGHCIMETLMLIESRPAPDGPKHITRFSADLCKDINVNDSEKPSPTSNST